MFAFFHSSHIRLSRSVFYCQIIFASSPNQATSRWTNSDAFSDEKYDALSNSVNGFVKSSCITDSFSLSQEIWLTSKANP